MKVQVIYWSGTGNTQMMAESVAAGAKMAGAEAELTEVGSASEAQIEACEYIAFGCPSMGDEVLEEDEMEPFFTGVESLLRGKKIALFGSYDWGDGEWMRDWAQRTQNAGAVVCGGEGLIVNLTPDEDGLEKCKALGKALAEM
jgi:flavodoxin, short chain